MESLKGQFLIAMPGMSDARFSQSLIYLVGHGDDGAMGLMVNQDLPEMDFCDVLEDMELGSRDELIKIDRVRERQILSGGPVDKGRGFVLHSADYNGPENTVRISNEIGLTATKDALRALSFGPEPRKALFALGYCGWDPGQLEDEILANGWLTAPHSEALLFDTPLEERYEGAMASLGISSAQLSHQAGTA
jgi:putative transcriptional regulator